MTEERVNFARWRHVDDDTAARFIEALDAMDGATEPMESDSDMSVKSFDSDKDVTSDLHARSKRSERSTPDTDDEIAMLLNPERMESIRRGVEQSKAGEVTRYPAGHFRQAYIDTYGVAPEDDDTVTITISREDAAWWSARNPRSAGVYERNIATACRAALEGER